MSLLKWTLAAAGAAMGVRYMSNRHRQRQDGSQSQDSGDSADWGRAAQDDRDSPSQWATPGGSAFGDAAVGSASGLSSSSATGIGGGSVSGLGGHDSGPGSTARSDDLLAPDSDVAPGSSASRF